MTRGGALAILADAPGEGWMAGNGRAGLTVHWPDLLNEHGYGLLWFGSWIVGDDGAEGEWFYSGRGGETRTAAIPEGAIGVRVRRWPSEGIEAEYADVLLRGGPRELWPEQLDYNVKQPFARIPADPKRAVRGIDP